LFDLICRLEELISITSADSTLYSFQARNTVHLLSAISSLSPKAVQEALKVSHKLQFNVASCSLALGID
jgi:hypothetical protein